MPTTPAQKHRLAARLRTRFEKRDRIAKNLAAAQAALDAEIRAFAAAEGCAFMREESARRAVTDLEDAA